MRELWTDPDKLGVSGGGYSAAGDSLTGLGVRFLTMVNGYAPGFGGDEEGKEFAGTFYGGAHDFFQCVDGKGQTMRFIGDGVRGNGKAFGNAREYADESSHQFLVAVADNAPCGDPPLQQRVRARGELLDPPLQQGMTVRGELLGPPLQQGLTVRGELLDPPLQEGSMVRVRGELLDPPVFLESKRESALPWPDAE
jgi:hypothetical protein